MFLMLLVHRMRRAFYLWLLCGLASCATHHLPPFGSANDWMQHGNIMENGEIKVDFGNDLLANAGDGGYELNFITSQAEFDAYEPKLAKYLIDVVNRIPLKIDSVDVIFTDEFMILSINPKSTWMPDYVRQADGAFLTVEAMPVEGLVQPEDELWRNLIVDKSKRQIIVVDRIVKKGKHYAFVYILQSEGKSSPYARSIHFDITNPRNIQSVGNQLEALMARSLRAAELSYEEYIMIADSCYMNGDYDGASNAFEKAFGKENEIQGHHLYKGACAAARAGFVDVAFERLFSLLEKAPNWCVDDPNRDQDLAILHKFVQWKNFCDIVTARRNRSE